MDRSDETDAVGAGPVYLKLRAQQVLLAKFWVSRGIRRV